MWLGTAGDDANAICALIETGLKDCDALVLTGGVSAGDYDLPPAAMELAGAEILFQGVDFKPGMACAYAVRDGKLLCGLSGNPAAALTNFYTVAAPALRKLCGQRDFLPREVSFTLKTPFRRKSPGTRLLRGRLCLSGGRTELELSANQANGSLSSAVGWNAIAVIPAGTGPLVKKNILSICRKCAAVPGIHEVCITTNGILLPELAVPLREARVRRINLSLDTLNGEKYAAMTRLGSLSNALRGLDSALGAGFDKVKVNAVLIGGFNDNEIPALANLTLRYPVDVRFIELMPMVDGGFGAFLPCGAVLERLPELVPTGSNGTARLYHLPGAKGNVGLISPLSDHFCGTCNRLRLTADGKLKPCLHSSAEYPIKGLDRAGMTEQFLRAIQAKPERHGELSVSSAAGRTMNQIGG